MNQKTVKLLRRFATESGQDYYGLKELWLHTPRAFRVELRQSMKNDLANANQTSPQSSAGAPPAA